MLKVCNRILVQGINILWFILPPIVYFRRSHVIYIAAISGHTRHCLELCRGGKFLNIIWKRFIVLTLKWLDNVYIYLKCSNVETEYKYLWLKPVSYSNFPSLETPCGVIHIKLLCLSLMYFTTVKYILVGRFRVNVCISLKETVQSLRK
jgi:hypothetical protein